MANDKKSGAVQKINPATDLTLDVPQTAPEGYEQSVRGFSFVGYWRAETDDILHCVLRGPAPEKVLEKSQSKYGVALVELLQAAIVSSSERQLEGRDMERWVPGPKNRKGEATFLTKALPGELICVSIREAVKDEMMMPEGTKVWLKVGKMRPIPGSDNTMYEYQKYLVIAKGEARAAGSNASAIPFD